MTLNKREMMLLFLTLVIVVGAITYMIGRSCYREWQDVASNRASFEQRIELAKTIIDQKDKWFGQLAEIQTDLPVYPLGKDVTADLLKILEQTASTHGLTLMKRDPGEERSVGQIYEFSIHCTWQGGLESLVHFLYAIQTKGAILDIRQLTVTPIAGQANKLKGGFTVDCAYSREAGSKE